MQEEQQERDVKVFILKSIAGFSMGLSENEGILRRVLETLQYYRPEIEK